MSDSQQEVLCSHFNIGRVFTDFKDLSLSAIDLFYIKAYEHKEKDRLFTKTQLIKNFHMIFDDSVIALIADEFIGNCTCSESLQCMNCNTAQGIETKILELFQDILLGFTYSINVASHARGNAIRSIEIIDSNTVSVKITLMHSGHRTSFARSKPTALGGYDHMIHVRPLIPAIESPQSRKLNLCEGNHAINKAVNRNRFVAKYQW